MTKEIARRAYKLTYAIGEYKLSLQMAVEAAKATTIENEEAIMCTISHLSGGQSNAFIPRLLLVKGLQEHIERLEKELEAL